MHRHPIRTTSETQNPEKTERHKNGGPEYPTCPNGGFAITQLLHRDVTCAGRSRSSRSQSDRSTTNKTCETRDTEAKHTNVSTNAWVYDAASTRCKGENGVGRWGKSHGWWPGVHRRGLKRDGGERREEGRSSLWLWRSKGAKAGKNVAEEHPPHTALHQLGGLTFH